MIQRFACPNPCAIYIYIMIIFKHLPLTRLTSQIQIPCETLGRGWGMVLVKWTRWLSCPYMAKIIKNLILGNLKSHDLGSWHEHSTKFICMTTGLTLTYFTAMSNLAKNSYYAYTRPKCQLNAYVDIDPLVKLTLYLFTFRN